MKTFQELNELELYFAIDSCGAFIWRMNHDMAHGRIPDKDHPAIDRDIVKMREQQLEAVRELPRIGVATPLDSEGRPTPEYWTWYRTWDAWKHNLSHDAWREVEAAVSRGLSTIDVQHYKTQAFATARVEV